MSSASVLDGRFVVTEILHDEGDLQTALGRDLQTDRPVALKILNRTDPELLLKLEEEFLQIAQVRSLYLSVPVSCSTSRPAYLVRPYIQGVTLKHFLREHRLDLDDCLTLAYCLLSALREIHSRGVHGTILSSSVVLHREENASLSWATLIDWGLPRLMASPGDLSREEDLAAVGRLLLQAMTGDPSGGQTLPEQIPSSLWTLARDLAQKAPLLDASTALELLNQITWQGVGEGSRDSQGSPELPRLQQPTFIGRKQLLQRILNMPWAQTPWVLIQGPRGAGRTRLLRELTRRFRNQGSSVFFFTGREGGEALQHQLSAWSRPWSDSREFDQPEGPRALMIDDLEQLTPEGLSLLEPWLLQPLSSRRLIFASTPSEESSRWLERFGMGRTMSLENLSVVETEQLLRSMAGELPLQAIELIVRQSLGSPFLAISLLQGLCATAHLEATARGWKFKSHALEEIQLTTGAARRLSEYPPPLEPATRDMLRAAAVLGRRFDLEEALLLASGGTHHAPTVLQDPHLPLFVLRPWGESREHAFVHPQLRQDWMEQLSPAEREQLHLRALETLRAQAQPDPELMAQHLTALQRFDEAAPFALDAARRLQSADNPERASHFLHLAARSSTTSESAIWEQLSELAMEQEDLLSAIDWLKTSLEHERDPLRRSVQRTRLGVLHLRQGQLGLAISFLDQALEILNEHTLRGAHRRQRSSIMSYRLLALARSGHPFRQLARQAWRPWLLGGSKERARIRQALSAARASSPTRLPLSLLLNQGKLEEALGSAEASLERASRRSPMVRGELRFQWIRALWIRGELGRARQQAHLLSEESERIGDVLGRARAQYMRLRMGGSPPARQELEELIQHCAQYPIALTYAIAGMSCLLMETGREAEAVAILRHHLPPPGAGAWRCILPLLLSRALRMQIRTLADLNDHYRKQLLRQAKEAAQLGLQRAASLDRPWALRELGRVQASLGRQRGGLLLLKKSAKEARRIGAELEQRLSEWIFFRASLNDRGGAMKLERARERLDILGLKPRSMTPRVEFSTSLINSGRSMTRSQSRLEVFRATREACLELLQAERALVLEVQYHEGEAHCSPVGESARLRYNHELAQLSLSSRQMILQDSEWQQVEGLQRAALTTPIFMRGRVAAILYITHPRQGEAFLPEQRQIIDFIVTLSGAALENAAGMERAQAYSMELEASVQDRMIQLRRLNQQLSHSRTQLNSTQAQLLQAGKMASVGTLFAGLSHELNNPLAVILGYVQLILRRTEESDAMRPHLVLVEEHVNRCIKLVKTLLDFSRRSPADHQSLRITSWILPVQELVAGKAKRLQVELSVTQPREDWRVRGIRMELETALLNLVNNALDVSPPQSELRVWVEHPRHDGRDWVVVCVLDQGPGIPPETAQQIFEPFFTTKEPGKGTGLGLSLTLQIMESHSGRVQLTQPQGGGSCFQLWIPEESSAREDTLSD